MKLLYEKACAALVAASLLAVNPVAAEDAPWAQYRGL